MEIVHAPTAVTRDAGVGGPEPAESKPSSRKMPDTQMDGVIHAWSSIARPSEAPDSFPPDVEVAFIDAGGLDVSELTPGMRIDFPIPQESRVYSGRVKEKHQRFGGAVSVASGEIDSGLPFANFSIVDDGVIALVMVATGQAIYQIEIDKRSGIGTVLDDRELDRYRRVDDGLLPPQRN